MDDPQCPAELRLDDPQTLVPHARVGHCLDQLARLPVLTKLRTSSRT